MCTALLLFIFHHRGILAAGEALIERVPVFRVGSDIDYAPLSSRNNGRVTGLDVDLISLLEHYTQFDFEHHLDTWSQVLEGLEHGRFDIVTGILATPERRERFDFSIPYIVDRYAVFIRPDSSIRSITDLPGLRAAVLDQDAVIENYLVPHDLHGEVIRTATFTDSLFLVHDGTADYTIAPLSLGVQLSGELNLGLQYTGRELFSVEYRLAVRKGEQNLLELLNDSILDMHLNGSLEQLRNKWAFYTPLSVSSPDPVSSLSALIAVLVCLLISAVFILIRLMHRSKKLQEQKQARLNEFLSSLLDTVPLPVWWKNNNLQYEGCSRAFLELMNLESGADLIGRTDVDFFPAEEAAIRTEQDRYVLEQGLIGFSAEKQEIIRSVLRNNSGEIIGLLACSGQTAVTESLRNTIRNLTVQLAEKESYLKQQSLIESGTGLFRSDFMNIRLHEEIEMYKRYGQTLALVFFDVFPDSSDYSEEMFLLVSELIRKNIRQVDVPGLYSDHIIYILLPHTSAAEAEEIVYKLNRLLQHELTLNTLRVSVSEYRGENESDFISEAVKKVLLSESRSQMCRK
ncbi:hypothetical protein JCM12856_05360 [Spirochaeta dissipatitropha]